MRNITPAGLLTVGFAFQPVPFIWRSSQAAAVYCSQEAHHVYQLASNP